MLDIAAFPFVGAIVSVAAIITLITIIMLCSCGKEDEEYETYYEGEPKKPDQTAVTNALVRASGQSLRQIGSMQSLAQQGFMMPMGSQSMQALGQGNMGEPFRGRTSSVQFAMPMRVGPGASGMLIMPRQSMQMVQPQMVRQMSLGQMMMPRMSQGQMAMPQGQMTMPQGQMMSRMSQNQMMPRMSQNQMMPRMSQNQMMPRMSQNQMMPQGQMMMPQGQMMMTSQGQAATRVVSQHGPRM